MQQLNIVSMASLGRLFHLDIWNILQEYLPVGELTSLVQSDHLVSSRSVIYIIITVEIISSDTD